MGYRVENQCVGCPPEIGCIGELCRNRNVHIYFCDKCGEELPPEELFLYEKKTEDLELCEKCFLKESLNTTKSVRELIDEGYYDD